MKVKRDKNLIKNKAISNAIFAGVSIVLIVIAAIGFGLYFTKSPSVKTETITSYSTSTVTSTTTSTVTSTSTLPPMTPDFHYHDHFHYHGHYYSIHEA